MDLSRHALSTTQREETKKFFKDRQWTENIKELNVSNLRAFNWQGDNHLEFVKPICPQLEALHVVNCGVSLRTLHSILLEAPQLTAISWSLWDSTSDDILFLLKTTKPPEGICFKNIKHLHLHMIEESLPQIQIARYLVLSCCRDLEELKICTWQIDDGYCTEGSFPVAADQSIPGFRQPSVENKLNNLNSLMVATVGSYANYNETYWKKLYDFVFSVVSRKSSSTKWKKFCVPPTIPISREQLSLLLHSDDFQSVQAIGVSRCWSPNAVHELKTLFARIGDNTVRSLQLRLQNYYDWIVEFYEPISRVGGHSLNVLRLSFNVSGTISAQQNINIYKFFSDCLNITELDLLQCSFERDICESLSKLKHLSKLQLRQCAISSKYNPTEVRKSKANLLTFVENCENITHLDVRGCMDNHYHFSCRLTDDDLLAFAMLRNLKSLTLDDIRGITQWTFLKDISEHCIFLTTLRIRSNEEHFNNSHIPILMESCRLLKHLAIDVPKLNLGLEVFWNLLDQAKNLERLCIKSCWDISLNIPVVAVESLKSLPQLHVLHLHTNIGNVDAFYTEMRRMLKAKESDCRYSFEIATGNERNSSGNRINTWINRTTGQSFISNKALPLNKAELCDKTPILNIPSS